MWSAAGVPDDRRSRLLRLLDGPPFALPGPLDAVSERWWRARPRVRAAVTGGIGLALLAAGAGHVASSPWGVPVTVLVATEDLEIGRQLTSSDVRRTAWPSDLVPAGALTDAAGTVVAPVPGGAVVTDRHVAEDGLGAALPDGHVAVPLPVELLPAVPVGARLDLVGADLDARGVTVAQGALVLSVDATHVWVAVGHDAAADVAAAGAGARLTAVVLPTR